MVERDDGRHWAAQALGLRREGGRFEVWGFVVVVKLGMGADVVEKQV